MRTLLLAGTAMMFMGGVALAQSTSSGSAGGSAAQMAPKTQPGTNVSNGTVSGNAMTGPAGVAKPETSMSSNQSTGMKSKDHTMPTQRRSTMSKTMNHNSSEKSSMGKSSMSHSSMGHNTKYISHRMGAGMPVNQSAGQYMQIAQKAVMAHNKMRAHDALGRAETDLLSNSYVQGSVNGPISTPAITDIRGARRAVDGGNFHQASMMIHKAMTDMHGRMGDKAGMMGRSSMMHQSGNTGMGNTGMHNNSSGMMGQAGTSDQSNMSNASGMSSASGGAAMPGAKPQAKQNSTMHNQMTKTTNATTN